MGILDALLGQNNPASMFVDSRPNAFAALGAGLASGQNISQGLSNAVQGFASQRQNDMLYQRQQQALNATSQYLENQFPDLATAVKNYALTPDQAFTVAIQRSAPGYYDITHHPGDVTTDTRTGQTTVTPTPWQPLPMYTGALVNSGTGEVKALPNGMGTIGTNADGTAIGTIGSPSIDVTKTGYTTTALPQLGTTQSALDAAALQYGVTGNAPPIGRTPQSQAYRLAVLNRWGELSSGGNIPQNKADLQAYSSALRDQVGYLNTTQRAFNTANDTLSNVLNYMQHNDINPSQFPDFNSLGNYLQAHGKDAGLIRGFTSQLGTLRAEYSQVLSKGGPRSVETDNAAKSLIPDNLSPSQLGQVAAQIKIDADNAINEAQNQVNGLQSQIGGVGGVQRTAAPAATAQPAQPGFSGTTQSGVKWSVTQ